MFVLRFFAGPIVERVNPLGLLCISTVLGTTGLLLLSSSKTAAAAWLAVTVYGFGKTFLWPTMLGIVGERFPRGGALTMGVIGGVGGVVVFLPQILILFMFIAILEDCGYMARAAYLMDRLARTYDFLKTDKPVGA